MQQKFAIFQQTRQIFDRGDYECSKFYFCS